MPAFALRRARTRSASCSGCSARRRCKPRFSRKRSRSRRSQKNEHCVAVAARARFAMKAVCETIGVTRSNVAERVARRSPKRRGRPPLPDGELLERIKAVIADMPSYGASGLSCAATASPRTARL